MVLNKALMFIWKGPRGLVKGHALPGFSLARTNSQEIVVAKFEEVILRLKELCTHMDIMVERLRQRPLFLYSKVWNKQLKEDEPPSIWMRGYTNSIIAETE